MVFLSWITVYQPYLIILTKQQQQKNHVPLMIKKEEEMGHRSVLYLWIIRVWFSLFFHFAPTPLTACVCFFYYYFLHPRPLLFSSCSTFIFLRSFCLFHSPRLSLRRSRSLHLWKPWKSPWLWRPEPQKHL